MNSNVEKYLTTLRRVPDDVILAIGAREIVPDKGDVCVCGWAVREQLARIAQTDAEEQDAFDWGAEPFTAWSPADRAPVLFGGNPETWRALYDRAPYDRDVEEAFTLRVMEAAGVA
jgi:hypothetical protein